MKLLVTGGAGFIGSNFIHFIIKKRPDWEITNFDKLTYAGNLANLQDIANHNNYKFIKGDIGQPDDVKNVFFDKFDYVINFAAETHVDRSLYAPALFLQTNTLGTQILLEQALETGVQKFIQVSTDEVYGSLGQDGWFSETSTMAPNSPYAASKASADLICRAYYKTYGLPVVITRSGNNYGPYQFPEKLIPFFITKAAKNEKLPLYGDGLHVRDWIYVDDHCEALLKVLEEGDAGEHYNIGGGNQKTNLEITKAILNILNKPEGLINFVKDRPGHDRRYALDYSKIKTKLGWQPQMAFGEGIKITIDWYNNNQEWLANVLTGEYRQFYNKHYRERK